MNVINMMARKYVMSSGYVQGITMYVGTRIDTKCGTNYM